jgi:hypothetical protein
VLNDANNHSFDFGAAGQAQTVRTLHAAGLAQTGLPGEITVVRAGATKVAFVAFAPYAYDAELLNRPAARSLIERAVREAPLVVVHMHAGAEGSAADRVTGREEDYLGEDRGNPATDGDLDSSEILHVTLSATGRFEAARIYPVQFAGTGRPVAGGGAIAFTSRLSTEDFGSSAARISRSGVIQAP